MKPLTTIAVGAVVLALGYGAADAQNGRVRQDWQDVRQDRRELHADNRDIRQDRRELAGDRREVNQDVKAGPTAEVTSETIRPSSATARTFAGTGGIIARSVRIGASSWATGGSCGRTYGIGATTAATFARISASWRATSGVDSSREHLPHDSRE
jgi:hypothetical protein